jgi:phenylalanyl-tRNA synthetase beta chain
MATITFDRRELEEFIGKSRPVEEIANAFEMLGMPVDKFDEEEIVADITTDRVDMFTVEGAGRAIGQFLGLKEPKRYKPEPSKIVMNIDRVPMRPFAVAFAAKGLKLDETFLRSLIMAQEKIHETFGRKRKKVAIGIHDLDKVSPPLAYRAFKYTTFVPLDTDKEMDPRQILKEHPKGIEYSWVYEGVNEYPLVLDSKGVISFPPIINAERTRVTDKTRNLLVEITGTSEPAISSILHIFAAAMADRGAKIENVKLKMLDGEKDSLISERKESMSIKFANQTLGLQLTAAETAALLKRMGYNVLKSGKEDLTLDVPTYRSDILHEVDFVEDVAVGYGYQNMKPDLPELLTIGKAAESKERQKLLRHILVAAGFNEITTWTLTNERIDSAAGITTSGVEIKNPRTNDFTRFRQAVYPSALAMLAENKTRGLPQRIFEVGRVADEKGACRTSLCAMITDDKAPFSGIRGILGLIENAVPVKIKQADRDFLIPGRAVSILSGSKENKEIGWCGEIHPQLLENFKLENPVAALELLLD